MAVRKRGEVWQVDLMIDGTRYRQAWPEATNKKQALQAEMKIRQEIFDRKYTARRNAVRFADFIDQTYLPWSKANKKSWQGDVWRTRMLKRYFGKKYLHDITQRKSSNSKPRGATASLAAASNAAKPLCNANWNC